MTIGLYFGSFNPVHIGHLIIANHILNEKEVEKIWLVVSPLNPFKEAGNLLNEYDRFHLVQKAIEDDSRMKATDIEFSLPKPSYTAHTLAYLSEKYPQHTFVIIMGSDSYQNLPRWKNSENILHNHRIIVYLRPGFDVSPLSEKTSVLNAPLLQISATHIRELITSGKSIKYLVHPAVEEEIYRSGLYRKVQKK